MQERLQKIIARAGIASRRHAELLITSGQVRVNGRVVRELGTKADAAKDRIEAAGRVVETKEGRRVYILLNKPPEVVSAMADPEGRKTLRNCLRGLPERGELLVRGAHAGFEEGRAAAHAVQGEASAGEIKAHRIGAADRGRDSSG